ncbi:hypothetical protein D3C81_2237350 [compost metagenome]
MMSLCERVYEFSVKVASVLRVITESKVDELPSTGKCKLKLAKAVLSSCIKQIEELVEDD